MWLVDAEEPGWRGAVVTPTNTGAESASSPRPAPDRSSVSQNSDGSGGSVMSYWWNIGNFEGNEPEESGCEGELPLASVY
jgi:hypothetical protein